MRKNKLLLLLALLLTAATGAMAQDYYAPSTDEVIILNEVYNASNSGRSSHSAIAWGGTASASNEKAGDPNNGGQSTSSPVSCYSVKGNGKGKNITLSITGVSKVIVYHERNSSRYIELRDGSKTGNIIGSGQTSTWYTEVELTATNQYSIFLHGTSTGSDDQDFYVYAIKLIAAPAAAAVPKHLIKATYRERTRLLEQPLPYATTIGELFEAVTGEHFSNLISTMSSMEMPLTGISSNNTSAVSIGELNGASTPVTVIADGEATIGIDFSGYVYGMLVSAISPLYANMKDGVKDADKWTVKVGDGQAQALPIGGLKGDGSETVTLQYNGRLKVKGVKAVVEAQADPKLATPLTIEAITAGSITVSNPKAGMQYSLDGGATKNAVTTDEIVLNPGDKVQFYGKGTSITSYYGTSITGSGNGFTCKVYGNIMSLVDETGFATATTLSESATFCRLFYGNTPLTDASGLLLPATKLAPNCYNQMFMGCTALTTAPVLPATTLVERCYYRMFYNCTALTAAPELPATELAPECYNQMFRICTSLTTAPALPATQLATSCYRSMFMGCTALTTAPVLPATQLAEYCYYQMFANCSNLAASPVLPATQLAEYCYCQMFTDCSKLATVTCLAESGINMDSSTSMWLIDAGSDVQGTKTFNAVSTAEWPSGNNGIPTGWTRVNIDN